MKLKYKYSVSYFIVLCISSIMKLFSLKINIKISLFILKCCYPLLKNRIIIANDNLSKAFPNLSSEKISEITYNSFKNLAITFTELLFTPNIKKDDFKNYIKFDKPELLTKLYNQKKGLILLSAHYGNWEFMALAGKELLGLDMLIPVKLLKNWYIDNFINKIRTAGGNKVVNMDKSAIEMIKQIKNGKAIALLADQSAHENTDIFVKLFNRPTLTYKAPAELALKYNIPLVFNFAERQEDGKYIIKSEEIKYDDLNFSKESVFILTQRYSDALEQQLIKNPDQWMWMHKRWKHQPKNEEN